MSLLGWLQACHPFPLVMVLSLTALLALAPTQAEVDAGKLALVLGAMLLSQLAIGWTNDYRDRHTDAVYQPGKPIPSGRLAAHLVPLAAIAVTLGSLALGALLGTLPLLLLAIGTTAGLGYDLGFKDTRFSPLAFVLAFAVLPPFVWTSLDIWRTELMALYLVASPLAIAAHLANVLPDLEGDFAAGRSNLGVILGRRLSLQALTACLVIPFSLLAVSMTWLDYKAALLSATLLTYAALVTAAAFSYRRESRDARVWAFRFVVVASVVLTAGWLASVI